MIVEPACLLSQPRRTIVTLPTGTLTIRVDRSQAPLDTLCTFAARQNPRRGFLVVSRVLGRHLPAPPSVMRRAIRDLAALIPADLPEPILVVGLAETAVCLGQGVHAELGRVGRRAGFVHSTRQLLDHPLLCAFEEPHSHASSHLLYRPQGFDCASLRSVILVDDEVSTGATLANLARALVSAIPGIEQIIVATLTDWSDSQGEAERMPRPTYRRSLLRGSLHWQPVPVLEQQKIETRSAFGSLAGPYDFGRLGRSDISAPPVPVLDPRIAEDGARLRIIGTGEFTYAPFVLAEQLERDGVDVVVQATSRSPVLVGGPITRALRFRDNYGAPAPNFLYNASLQEGRRSIVCHESPPGSIDSFLIKELGATTLFFDGRPPCAP